MTNTRILLRFLPFYYCFATLSLNAWQTSHITLVHHQTTNMAKRPDTAALALLADTLNLEVRYLTPWYVTVRPR